jgi:hypothetical protein
MEHIMRHDWWSRMWTLQEFTLAERPIVVVGDNKVLWKDLVKAAHNTISSNDARDEMVRRKRQNRENIKANELVINNIMPPDEADDIRGKETSIHLVPMFKALMDAHKSQMTYQLSLQDYDPQLIASDFLLKARMRQAKDPRDKLYGLYHILQACHYSLPKIDYSQAVEKIYEDVTFSLVSQSKSWWILSHLFRTREDSAIEVPSWVPDFCSRIQWHQREEFTINAVPTVVSQATQWPHNSFYLERLEDGGICTSGIFLWTVTSVTSTLLPTPALDKSFEELFEESKYAVLLKASEDFLFTMANWLNFMTNPDHLDLAGTDTPILQDPNTAPQALRAVSRAFLRASSTRGHVFGSQMQTFMAENSVYKIISAMQQCMSPSLTQPCLVCGTSSAHESDDAMQHFQQRTSNQPTWLNIMVYMLYGCALNRSMFRTSALNSCPGHFGFCGGQPRPGDELVLLPGVSDPVIIRRRPALSGADYYRIVGVTSGIFGKSEPERKGHDNDAGNFCSGFCEILDDATAASRYEPRSFCLV